MFKFKIWFKKWEPLAVLQEVLDGDVLDFVDKIIELFGKKTLPWCVSVVELKTGSKADFCVPVVVSEVVFTYLEESLYSVCFLLLFHQLLIRLILLCMSRPGQSPVKDNKHAWKIGEDRGD